MAEPIIEPKVPDKGETNEQPPKVEVKVEPPVTPTVENSDIPEKFKGKTVAEVAKSYVELEKTLGDRPTKEELEEARVSLDQWKTLGEVIKGNPALLKAIEEEVKGKSEPEDKKKDDVRSSLTIRTIGEFETRLGIDTLPQDQRSALHGKIGDELKDIYDPDGKKTVQQIIEEIPLDKLPKALDRAYKLATSDDAKEKARLQGMLDARENNGGAFGSIPSGSANSEVNLSPEEREVAKKLGISEEKYAAQKKKDLAN